MALSSEGILVILIHAVKCFLAYVHISCCSLPSSFPGERGKQNERELVRDGFDRAQALVDEYELFVLIVDSVNVFTETTIKKDNSYLSAIVCPHSSQVLA